jgi:hypothetical protein
MPLTQRTQRYTESRREDLERNVEGVEGIAAHFDEA